MFERADKAVAELSELTFSLYCLEAAEGNQGKALKYFVKALRVWGIATSVGSRQIPRWAVQKTENCYGERTLP